MGRGHQPRNLPGYGPADYEKVAREFRRPGFGPEAARDRFLSWVRVEVKRDLTVIGVLLDPRAVQNLLFLSRGDQSAVDTLHRAVFDASSIAASEWSRTAERGFNPGVVPWWAAPKSLHAGYDPRGPSSTSALKGTGAIGIEVSDKVPELLDPVQRGRTLSPHEYQDRLINMVRRGDTKVLGLLRDPRVVAEVGAALPGYRAIVVEAATMAGSPLSHGTERYEVILGGRSHFVNVPFEIKRRGEQAVRGWLVTRAKEDPSIRMIVHGIAGGEGKTSGGDLATAAREASRDLRDEEVAGKRPGETIVRSGPFAGETLDTVLEKSPAWALSIIDSIHLTANDARYRAAVEAWSRQPHVRKVVEERVEDRGTKSPGDLKVRAATHQTATGKPVGRDDQFYAHREPRKENFAVSDALGVTRTMEYVRGRYKVTKILPTDDELRKDPMFQAAMQIEWRRKMMEEVEQMTGKDVVKEVRVPLTPWEKRKHEQRWPRQYDPEFWESLERSEIWNTVGRPFVQSVLGPILRGMPDVYDMVRRRGRNGQWEWKERDRHGWLKSLLRQSFMYTLLQTPMGNQTLAEYIREEIAFNAAERFNSAIGRRGVETFTDSDLKDVRGSLDAEAMRRAGFLPTGRGKRVGMGKKIEQEMATGGWWLAEHGINPMTGRPEKDPIALNREGPQIFSTPEEREIKRGRLSYAEKIYNARHPEELDIVYQEFMETPFAAAKDHPAVRGLMEAYRRRRNALMSHQ